MRNLKTIHTAINTLQPQTYEELIRIVSPFVTKTWGWNVNNVFFNGYYQGIRLTFCKDNKTEYLPNKTDVYTMPKNEELPAINVNTFGKLINS